MRRHPSQGPRPRSLLLHHGLVGLVLTAVAAWAVAAVTGQATPGAGDPLDAQREQIRALEAELIGIDGQADAAAAAHAQATRRVTELRGRIAQNQVAIRQAKRSYDRAVTHLSDRLVAIYTQDQPDFVEILLNSDGLAEAVDTQQSLERIGRQDASIVAQVQEQGRRLVAARRELLSDSREAVANEREAAARQGQLEGLLVSRRAVLSQARAGLASMVAARQRQAALDALARSQAQREQQLALRADPATPTSSPDRDPAQDPGPSSAPAVETASPSGDPSATLERIAQCESGGDPSAVSSSGQYRGKYQFDQGTWEAVGGSGDPAAASEAEQDRRAAMLYAQRGSAPWPICGAQ